MANVELFTSTNMISMQTWYGYVPFADSSQITVSGGFHLGYYFGSFRYDSSNNVYGTLNSYYDYYGGSVLHSITNMNFDANVAFNYIQDNDLYGLFSLVLAGPDVINGSNSADVIVGFLGPDTIDGYMGDDVIFGGGGNDLIRGSLGNDYIFGDAGNDMAVLAGRLSNYQISYNWASKTYSVKGADGMDTFSSIERIRASDGDRYIEDAIGLTGVVHRFFNTQLGVHFYTSSNAEANSVRNSLPQYDHEGLSFRVAPQGAIGSTDIFRFFNTQTGYHFYTASTVERDQIIKTLPQFNYEGVGYKAYSQDAGPQEELYRFFNTTTGAHFFTTSEVERDNVMGNLPQFRYEGIAYYVDVA